jgi:neutral amino acid transport system permease protein
MALADFTISLLTFVAIYSLFGIGLNLKYGFTGLIDFGHVVYFMIGAYIAVVFTLPAGEVTSYAGIGGLGLPALLSPLPLGGLLAWVLAVLVAMVVSAAVSLLVGVPTLRLREDYLAITALGIAVILNSVVNNERWLFNGPFGIREIHQPLRDAFPVGTGSFQLNMAILGGVSVLVLGYAAYRTALIVRGVARRPAVAVTVATLALAAGGTALLRSGPVRLAGLLGLAVTAGAGWWAFTRAPEVWPVFTLGATEVFVLWYVVGPVVQDGPVELVRNVLWLFDASAGTAGGLDYSRFVLVLSVAVLGLGYLFVERLMHSPYGRVLRAIREDEDVPQALGRETYRYKIQSLMIGSALAGAAGAVWAVHVGFIAPTQFEPPITFFAFTAVIVGGTANNRGVVLGTGVFWVINSGTRFLDDYVPSEFAVQLAAARLILIGLLLMVILYYRPQGLLGEQDYEVPVPGHGGGTDE